MGKWSDEQARIAEEQRVVKALDHMAKIAEAERAIVEAADKWRDNLAYADRCELELAASVDAWRKLRDAR